MPNRMSKEEDALFEILKQNMTEIWCMVSIDETQIIHCSRSFRELWDVHGEDLSRFSCDAKHTDSEPVRATGWLREFLPTLEQFVEMLRIDETGLQRRLENSPFVAEVHLVSDADGFPVGRFAFLRTFSPINNSPGNRAAGPARAASFRSPVNTSRDSSSVRPESNDRSGSDQAHVAKTSLPSHTGMDQKSFLSSLSPRELEIAHYLYDGAKNNAIAIRLNISCKTVEKHRSNIMKKFKVQSIAGLIRVMAEARFTDVGRKTESE